MDLVHLRWRHWLITCYASMNNKRPLTQEKLQEKLATNLITKHTSFTCSPPHSTRGLPLFAPDTPHTQLQLLLGGGLEIGENRRLKTTLHTPYAGTHCVHTHTTAHDQADNFY